MKELDIQVEIKVTVRWLKPPKNQTEQHRREQLERLLNSILEIPRRNIEAELNSQDYGDV